MGSEHHAPRRGRKRMKCAHVVQAVHHAVGNLGNGVKILGRMGVPDAIRPHPHGLRAGDARQHVLKYRAFTGLHAQLLRRQTVHLAARLTPAAGVFRRTQRVEQLHHAQILQTRAIEVRRQRRGHRQLHALAPKQPQIGQRPGLEPHVLRIFNFGQARPLGNHVLPALAGQILLHRVLRRLPVALARQRTAVILRNRHASRGKEHLVHPVPDIHAVEQRAVQIKQRRRKGDLTHSYLPRLPANGPVIRAPAA